MEALLEERLVDSARDRELGLQMAEPPSGGGELQGHVGGLLHRHFPPAPASRGNPAGLEASRPLNGGPHKPSAGEPPPR